MMTLAELIEEIRALLLEPQMHTVDRPWQYTEYDLVPQIRSALRFLRSIGVNLPVTLSAKGVWTGTLLEPLAMLVCYRVASEMLKGDLMQKLRSGEMGLYFRAGPDIIDTRAASPEAFKAAASGYERDFERILLQVVTGAFAGDLYGGDTGWDR
jgi:hypothetical protein